MSDDALIDALTAFAADDPTEATRSARRAAAAGDDLARAIAAYLDHLATQGATAVYAARDAFAAFIRGGGNRRLYRAVNAVLREIYRELPQPFALADVGCGDGLALVPAVDGIDATIAAIEPSTALLSTATQALERAGARFEAFAMPIEDFVRDHGDHRFDLIQSTFALQSLPRDARRDVLAWARRAAGTLAIIEFDVPSFASPRDPAFAAHVLARYRRGIAEYDGDELVVQGFLMPVMFGYFTSGRARTNHEQPAAEWVADLRAAGYHAVSSSVIDDYWWAPAVLLRAA
jgi:Methyltransferase domain